MIYPFGLRNTVLSTRTYRVMAVLLSVVMLVVTNYIIPSLASARDEMPNPPKILIFPFTNASTVTTDSNGAPLTLDLSSNVRLDIDALGYYKSTGFSVLNPSLQRALNVENSIGLADLEAPSATPDRAQKIASIVGTPYFLTGNIETVSTDPTAGTVTIVVDGTFYNTITGAQLKQATVTGVAAPASKDYDPDQLQTTAIANASGQLVAALIAPRIVHALPVSAVPKSNVSSNIGRGLLYVLGIALALVIIKNHGGSHTGSSSSRTSTTTGGSSTTGPPPPP
jgi:hypothetical protein